MATAKEKLDKYEQLLTKYDWHSPRPPRGYQYGVGRGAKAFVTTAELSVSTTIEKPTTLENEVFSALDRVERRAPPRPPPSVVKAQQAEPAAPAKLSLEDLETINTNIIGNPLVPRSARDEAAEAAEEYLFSDERVLTAYDVLQGKTTAAQQDLRNLLSMGSPEEQTTWVTHSRAYREMGARKKALQTLVDGCAVTGTRGGLIWLERLRYIPTSEPAARRRLLEEAVEACPGASELWERLLPTEPPHEQLHWLQRAVIACPSSEQLWLRVVAHAPTVQDQKKIIQRALQRTPELPLLWSKLARLEPSAEVGKQIFRGAAEQFPSLALVIEAAKYVEWSATQLRGPLAPSTAERQLKATAHEVRGELDAIVRTARRTYLLVNEERSRQQWVDLACALAEQEKYVWTAAHMFAYFTLPTNADLLTKAGARHDEASALTPPTTWVEDVMACVPNLWGRHAVLCALWGTLLLFATQSSSPALPEVAKSRSVLSPSAERLLRAAVATAPETALTEVMHLLLTPGASSSAAAAENEEEAQELGPGVGGDSPRQSPSARTSVELPTPLAVVLAQTLVTPATGIFYPIMLLLAKAFTDRQAYRAAEAVLLRARDATAQRDVTLSIALAKTYAALSRLDDADACLLQATEDSREGNPLAATGASASGDDTQARHPKEGDEDARELAWIALVVHRRSRRQDVRALLDRALAAHARSTRLWRMYLEDVTLQVRQELALVAEAPRHAGAPPTPPRPVAVLIRDVRSAYGRALADDHGRRSLELWVFAAVVIESELLRSAATARALLLEATAVCTEGLADRIGAGGTPEMATVLAAVGVARAKVEQRHTGDGPAREVVEETLLQLPKARDGSFTVSVGELLALYIHLAPPAARGRAAMQVVRQWHSRDPLALMAVAQLYHDAGNVERAFSQAKKAVAAGHGRCGDTVALLWRLARMPAYQAQLAAEVHGSAEKATAHPAVTAEDAQRFAFSFACSSLEEGTHATPQTWVPSSGPLWLAVAEQEDPTNLTLIGFRNSVEMMLTKVMQRLALK